MTISSAQWTWTSAAGTVRDLSVAQPYLRPGGVVGHMAAPVSLIGSLPPTIDGGLYRGHRYQPRDVFLSLMAHTRDPDTWRTTYRTLVDDFDTTSGAGTLTVGQVNGEHRSLSCRYVTGLESPVEGEPGVVKIASWVVHVRAYDPWWYGPEQTRTFSVSTSQTLFGNGSGATPFYIMPTELIGSGSSVTNPGDVEAYPVWTLNGPMTSATITAQSGAAFTITSTLSAGEYITVDTDPRTGAFSKVVDDSGTNLWGTATSDYPNLWALPAGTSTVTVAMSGTTSSSSTVIAFRPRYRTA